jgi:Na+/proline symporter
MVQRLLAARNQRDSRTALLSSWVLVAAQFTLFLVIGACLYALYELRHLQPPAVMDRIYPLFVWTYLPRGVAGLVMAAILAAAMSNLSAALNSLASTTVMDFLHGGTGPERPSGRSGIGGDPAATGSVVPFLERSTGPERPSGRLGIGGDPAATGSVVPFLASGAGRRPAPLALARVVTLVWGAILFGVAMLARNWGSVLQTGLSIASVLYGSLLGVFLLGVLTRRVGETAAMLGMAAGLVLMLYVKFQTPIAFTWYVPIGTSATFLAGLAASFVWKEIPDRAKA